MGGNARSPTATLCRCHSKSVVQTVALTSRPRAHAVDIRRTIRRARDVTQPATRLAPHQSVAAVTAEAASLTVCQRRIVGLARPKATVAWHCNPCTAVRKLAEPTSPACGAVAGPRYVRCVEESTVAVAGTVHMSRTQRAAQAIPSLTGQSAAVQIRAWASASTLRVCNRKHPFFTLRAARRPYTQAVHVLLALN